MAQPREQRHRQSCSVSTSNNTSPCDKVYKQSQSTQDLKVQTEFMRTEEKFFVPTSAVTALVRLIESHLGTRWKNYPIQSIYLDSKSLDFYKQHIQNKPVRYKVRLRSYSHSANFAFDTAFAEYKKKEEGVTKKRRLRVGGKYASEFLNGHFLEEKPLSLKFNSDIDSQEIQKTTSRLNQLIKEYRLQPILKVSYKRRAIEKGGLRLTLDEQIEAQSLQDNLSLHEQSDPEAHKRQKLYREARPEQYVILEAKYSKSFPTWLSKFLEKIQLSPAEFSKYCWGLSACAHFGRKI